MCSPEGVEGRELTLTWPPGVLQLGVPPRGRYPLALFLLDTKLVGAPLAEALQARQIVSMCLFCLLLYLFMIGQMQGLSIN